MNQQEDSKDRAPSIDQRSRGQAWRRLIVRCSVTRRPYFMFQIYTRVANFEIVSHAAVVDDEDKIKFVFTPNMKWLQIASWKCQC